MNNEKYCTGCKTTKPIERFSKNKAQKSGYANWCKDCLRGLYTRQEYLDRRKERRNGNLEHALLIECRARAKKAGLPFNLENGDIEIPQNCPVLGIALVKHQGRLAFDTPTVDRINPELGYVKGNVAVISWRANKLKSDCADPEIFEAIAKYIRNNKPL
jgi:hypothetical protein